MTPEEAERLLEETAARISEHFDAVQILATWSEGGLSHCVKRGTGNWYARIGMARELLMCDQANTAAHELKEVLPKPPKDDDEDWKENA